MTLAECVPSEKIRQIPHQVYVIIEQDTGRIEGAYCTCFAGLGQTCNHVAALLFKVDDAWKRGITNQACTSLPCIWNKYGSTKDIAQPKRIQEMKWKKHHYKNTDDEKVENPTVRQLFTPHARKAAGATLQKLRDALAVMPAEGKGKWIHPTSVRLKIIPHFEVLSSAACRRC
uniref:SWIM-type domain-containing protein n=1 Tax=Knipowitschia caucasica TaxID=637954 RepID=A0AAV2JQV3_KNICA